MGLLVLVLISVFARYDGGVVFDGWIYRKFVVMKGVAAVTEVTEVTELI